MTFLEFIACALILWGIFILFITYNGLRTGEIFGFGVVPLIIIGFIGLIALLTKLTGSSTGMHGPGTMAASGASWPVGPFLSGDRSFYFIVAINIVAGIGLAALGVYLFNL